MNFLRAWSWLTEVARARQRFAELCERRELLTRDARLDGGLLARALAPELVADLLRTSVLLRETYAGAGVVCGDHWRAPLGVAHSIAAEAG